MSDEPEYAAVPPQAVAELRALKAAQRLAEERLGLYMRGVVDGLGIDRMRVRGFDDERGALILGGPR